MSDRSSTLRSELYPEIEPYETGVLELDALHRMYWEECGNPRGTPVLFLHGGPGAGSAPAHRRFFDPAHYRIVVYDQRGAGRSRPLGELRQNTTPLLIQDIERLRRHLGITHWLVFGGSWGSTLALAYATEYPERCAALVLRGIFLCRESEIEWFLYGLRNLFPEVWAGFAGVIPVDEREDLLTAYYQRLTHPDPAIHMPAARAWSVYDAVCRVRGPASALRGSLAGTAAGSSAKRSSTRCRASALRLSGRRGFDESFRRRNCHRDQYFLSGADGAGRFCDTTGPRCLGRSHRASEPGSVDYMGQAYPRLRGGVYL
mgnify:CR=1 FL=1